MKRQSTEAFGERRWADAIVVANPLDQDLEPELIRIIDALARASAEREHAVEHSRRNQRA